MARSACVVALTVLSARVGHTFAKQFLDWVADMDMFFIDDKLKAEGVELFKQQNTAWGVSMVDCSNLVVVRRLNISHIFSFDK